MFLRPRGKNIFKREFYLQGFVFLDTPYEEQQYALLFKQIPKSFEIEQEISQSVRDLIENSSLYK